MWLITFSSRVLTFGLTRQPPLGVARTNIRRLANSEERKVAGVEVLSESRGNDVHFSNDLQLRLDYRHIPQHINRVIAMTSPRSDDEPIRAINYFVEVRP